jgi:hypothetical protein
MRKRVRINMSKLHELLATSSSTDAQAAKVTAELTNTFTKKQHLFGEKIVTTTPLAAEGAEPPTTEIQSTAQTTVTQELKWVSEIIAKALDVDYQIDVANTHAKAHIVLEDGTEIAKDVPATALLQLEKSLKKVQDLAIAIPTLDPAKGFTPDGNKGAGYFIARPVRKNKTKKINTVLTLAPATEHHPAQVSVFPEDVKVADVVENEWSSLITPSTKADIIDRTDQIIRAVKKARARANEQVIDTDTIRIGSKLLEYVFNGAK